MEGSVRGHFGWMDGFCSTVDRLFGQCMSMMGIEEGGLCTFKAFTSKRRGVSTLQHYNKSRAAQACPSRLPARFTATPTSNAKGVSRSTTKSQPQEAITSLANKSSPQNKLHLPPFPSLPFKPSSRPLPSASLFARPSNALKPSIFLSTNSNISFFLITSSCRLIFGSSLANRSISASLRPLPSRRSSSRGKL
jgi:hypothetical protein